MAQATARRQGMHHRLEAHFDDALVICFVLGEIPVLDQALPCLVVEAHDDSREHGANFRDLSAEATCFLGKRDVNLVRVR